MEGLSQALSLIMALVLSAMASQDNIRISENGYQSILIAFKHDVPKNQCPLLISNLEKLMFESSKLLFEATNRRAYFKSVYVLLPATWEPSQCSLDPNIVANAPHTATYDASNIRVTPGDGVHPGPYTLQSKGCGEPGEYISLSASFLKNSNASRNEARLMVREWAKFRYGVFDEVGYHHDPMYPEFYTDYVSDGSTAQRPTACTDLPLAGERNCHGSMCSFKPDPNANVHSSLMSFPQLTKAHEFCNDSTHNADAPTKQNLFCEGRSTWDVISTHNDIFGHLRSQLTFPPRPSVTYMRPKNRRIVFLLQTGREVRDKKNRWQNVRSATYRMLGLLSSSSSYNAPEVGLVEYTSGIDKVQPVVNLKSLSLSRSLISRYINDKEGNCIVCGIREALKLLQQAGDSASGGEIVVVSQAPYAHKAEDLKLVAMEAIDRAARIHVIIYGGVKSPNAGILREMAKETGGHAIDLEEAGGVSNLVEIVEAYERCLEAKNTAKIYARLANPINSVIEDTFMVDADAKEVTLTTLYSKMGTKSMALLAPDNSVVNQVDPPMGDYEADIIRVERWPGVLKSGIWRYKIETVPSDNGPLYVEVRVTSHGRDVLELTPYFDWNGKPPLVLRAQLKMGQKNVFRARVTARVRIVGEHRSEEVKTLLRDDGLGDPDIQRADGLYSAYFTHFRPGSNRYYFTFEASDNSGRAQVMTSAQRQPRIVPDEAYDQLHAEDTLPCCGSSTAGYSFVASGPFSRILPGPMIMYDHQASIIEDIYPPVRILDLTVEAATDLFRFSWTAPGADYHEGRAERYDFRFASFRINSSSFLEATPIALPEPLGAGEKEELVLKPGQIFQEQEITYGRIYYFAFRTFHGEWSPVSNIVRASLPFPPTEAPAPLPSENNKPAPPNHWTLAADPKQRSRLIMIIAACVGFVVIGTLVILCVTFCVKRRRKDVKPKDKNPDVIRSLATEDWEKGRVGNGSIHSNGSTPQKETPQYIGASQLLTTTYHHDQEYSVEHINQDLYCKTSNGSDPGSSNGGMQPYPPSYHSSTTGSANTGTTSGGLYRVNTPDPAMYLYQDYPELDARPKYVHFNDGWAPGSDKLPPPVPPKPSLYTGNDALVCQVPTGNVSILNNSSSNVLNDSRASMCSDHKKVRTVTQV